MERLRPRLGRVHWWGILAALFFLLATGCRPAPLYPRDIFPEMHYQQSYRSQEPPRLAPPADSVPITGREVSYGLIQVVGLKNPVPATPQTLTEAKELFRINCAACHGANGRGDGFVGGYFRRANTEPPVDFASERVKSRTDGELFWAITNGFNEVADLRGVTRMPSFRALLTEKQRWTLVHFIRTAGGQ